MVDFYQKITDMQGSLEDLIRKVPGFKGYFEKQDRRAADNLLRDHIKLQFQEQLAELDLVSQQMIAKSGLEFMDRIQGIQSKLQTFIDRINTAAQGYAGMFDAIKVKEDALARIYAFDNALLTYQEQFSEGLKHLRETLGTSEMAGVLDQLDSIVTEANNTFKHRVEAIQDLKEGA